MNEALHTMIESVTSSAQKREIAAAYYLRNT
jgi:hypothetical protein